MGHNYMGHNNMGHNYMGQNYTSLMYIENCCRTCVQPRVRTRGRGHALWVMQQGKWHTPFFLEKKELSFETCSYVAV